MALALAPAQLVPMRNDLVERVHSLSLDNEQRNEVMELFGCVSLATAVLRAQDEPRGSRRAER
jgi:hypothetical protein